MAEIVEIIKTTFQLRRGPEATWLKNNPVLANGEPSFVTDKFLIKIGDGVTRWKDLPFLGTEDGKIQSEVLAYAFSLLVGILQEALFKTDKSIEINKLLELFGSNVPDVPDVPDKISSACGMIRMGLARLGTEYKLQEEENEL